MGINTGEYIPREEAREAVLNACSECLDEMLYRLGRAFGGCDENEEAIYAEVEDLCQTPPEIPPFEILD